MNTFLGYEAKGREKFEQILKNNNITDYKFSEDEYCPYDCTYSNDRGEKFLVEIKHRDDKYAGTPDLLLEKKKYDSLHIEAEKDNARILYINTFDCREEVKIAELTNREFKWEESYQQRTQCSNRSKITKLVTFITQFSWVK